MAPAPVLLAWEELLAPPVLEAAAEPLPPVLEAAAEPLPPALAELPVPQIRLSGC
jgi:hypothetical protein